MPPRLAVLGQESGYLLLTDRASAARLATTEMSVAAAAPLGLQASWHVHSQNTKDAGPTEMLIRAQSAQKISSELLLEANSYNVQISAQPRSRGIED